MIELVWPLDQVLFKNAIKDDKSAAILYISFDFFQFVDGDREAASPATKEEQSWKGAGWTGRSNLVRRLETSSEIRQERYASQQIPHSLEGKSLFRIFILNLSSDKVHSSNQPQLFLALWR